MSQQYTVRAIPAQGHLWRRRAGLKWPATPVKISVVDAPTGEGEITPAQFAQLRADPHIAVTSVGDADPMVSEGRAELLAALAKVDALRKDLADQAEAIEEERAQFGREAVSHADKLRELESEIERLRAKPSRR